MSPRYEVGIESGQRVSQGVVSVVVEICSYQNELDKAFFALAGRAITPDGARAEQG